MKIGLVPQVVVNARDPSSGVPYVPLGLLSLAGALDRRRHPVEIVDLTLGIRKGILPFDGHFEAAAAALLAARGYDLVGFSAFSSTWHHTLEVVTELRRLSPSTLIVLGGPQATACDRETLAAFPVDFVVRGEGELTFAELVEALDGALPLGGIPGLTLRQDGAPFRAPDRALIEDLDRLPMPAYELVSVRGHPKVPLEVVRGCPHRCTYCSTSVYWRRQVRRKSVGRVLAELTRLAERHHAGGISFVDDTFTLRRAWVRALCAALTERSFPLRWLCSTRIDAVDDELLAAMARAGCASIFYGIESGSARIQRSIKKGLDLGTVLPNLRLTAGHGIGITASMMMGFPDETEDDLRATLALRARIQLLFPERQAIQVHVLTPDVDTEITRENLDRLEYDGFHSDGAGGDLAPSDRALILAHKPLFLAYYHVATRHLERAFVTRVSCFLTAAQLICTWSVLYAMLRDEDPLAIVRRWIAHFERHPEPEGVGPDAPLLARAVASATAFFRGHFTAAEGFPAPICELFLHELELTKGRGAAAVGEARGPAPVRDYAHDPRETIALIRDDFRKVAAQAPRPTRITYARRRRGAVAP
ncbi:MAG: radical SAM protein [Pseudomonadota bacterium]